MLDQENLLCPSTFNIGLNRGGKAKGGAGVAGTLVDLIVTVEDMDNEEYLLHAETPCSVFSVLSKGSSFCRSSSQARVLPYVLSIAWEWARCRWYNWFVAVVDWSRHWRSSWKTKRNVCSVWLLTLEPLHQQDEDEGIFRFFNENERKYLVEWDWSMIGGYWTTVRWETNRQWSRRILDFSATLIVLVSCPVSWTDDVNPMKMWEVYSNRLIRLDQQ